MKRKYIHLLIVVLISFTIIPLANVRSAVYADDGGLKGRIWVPFDADLNISWDFNDFNVASTNAKENRNLAIAGCVLSTNIEVGVEEIERSLSLMGFKYPKHFYMDHYGVDQPGMMFARSGKKVNGKYVVAAVYRGTCVRWNNWSDLFTDVGSQGNGFLTAGQEGTNKLKEYIAYVSEKTGTKLTKKNTILFITGHSYGGAVGSQVTRLAKDDVADLKNIFTYVFAPPNYDTQEAIDKTDYSNIHYYRNNNDQVPNVPVGFRKVGISHEYILDQLSETQRNNFENAYFNFREKTYDDDGGGSITNPFRDHMLYTYMSFLMSDLNQQEITALTTGRPAHPEIKSIKVTGNKVMLKWTKVKFATRYSVYMSVGNESKYKQVASTSNSYLNITSLKAGKTYYFKLKSFAKGANGKNVYSDFSDVSKVNIEKKPSQTSYKKITKSPIKVGGYYYKIVDYYKVARSKEKNKGYKIIISKWLGNSSYFVNGKYIYAIKEYQNEDYDYLVRFLANGKKMKNIRKLYVDKADGGDWGGWSIDLANNRYMLLTKWDGDTWDYTTYRYDIQTRELKKIMDHCSLLDLATFTVRRSGNYVLGVRRYHSDARNDAMDLYEITDTMELRHIRSLGDNADAIFVEDELYFVSFERVASGSGYSNIAGDLYKCKRDGSELTLLGSFEESSGNDGMVHIGDVYEDACEMIIGGEYFILDYSTGELVDWDTYYDDYDYYDDDDYYALAS